MLSQKTQQYLLTALVILFSCVTSGNVTARVSDIQFKHYSVAEGLSQSTVTDIVEDHQGFMWFATTNGLNRFDGYEFQQYHPQNNFPGSLPGAFVRKLFVDSNNRLWVATYEGLARYLPDSDSFQHYTSANSGLKGNQIWTIHETPEGEIWVSDQHQMYKLEPRTQRFTPLSFNGDSSPKDVRLIFNDGTRTWIGTDGQGVYLLDNSSNQLFSLAEANPWNIRIEAHYLFDLKIIEENIWLATEQGAYIVSPEGNILRSINTRSDDRLPSDAIRSIESMPGGKVWLGTTNGILITNTDFSDGYTIDQQNDSFVGLKDRLIIKLYADQNGTIWIGTFSSGVHLANPSFSSILNYTDVHHDAESFSNTMVWGLDEHSDGSIWVATQSGGLNLFDATDGSFRHFLGDFEHSIFDVVADPQNNLWLGTSGGLFVYHFDGSQLTLKEHLFSGHMVDQIALFADKIWLWSEDLRLISIDHQSYQENEFVLPNSNIKTAMPVHLDTNNNLWLKTNLGLALINLASQQFNQLIINVAGEQPVFLTVAERKNGYIAATANHGVLILDKYSYQLKERITPHLDDRLSHFSTALIDHNSVWLAGLQAIVQISLDTKQVIRTVASEMLNFDDLTEGSGLLTRNGEIIIGGTSGFHIIDPAKMDRVNATQRFARPPVITGLKIFNRPVDTRSKGTPLTKPIHQSQAITLPNNASPFTLTFAQINPVTPKTVNYRYRLKGLSDEWLHTDHGFRQATFTNLMFGAYTFEVQSRVKDGPWSASNELDIKVTPPLWFHHNALIVYGFLAILLFGYWYKQYKSGIASQRAIQESEERLKLTLWSSGDELWDWDIYRGQVFRSNTWGTLDFPQDDIRANSSYQANIHQDDIPRVQQALKEHLELNTDHFQVTYRARTFKGEWIWLLDRGKVVHRDNNNQPVRMTGTLKNISHLKQAEEQLKLFKRSIETISDGVFIADTSFKFISVNQAYCERTGETREQALASYLKFHQYPEAFTEEVKKALQHKGNWNGEVESRRTNGDKYEIELNIDAIQGENGRITHYVGVFSDITSRKSTEKELLKLANTDPLTEMPNRSFFQASHMSLVRKNVTHALMCLDMDNFKKINDSLGHQTGDILIKQIGKRLQKVAGNDLTCYRLGGDEFSVLVDNSTDIHRITHFAQRVLDEMARPFIINKQEFVLGASLGIAFYPEDGYSPQELLKNADTAMYFAKNSGGNKYQFFSGEMNQNAVRQLQIENLIRNGLKEDLFTVFYQPKVDIASGKLVSMEALVRFEHPEKGIVSPAQFIPLAEETGQIIDIGEQVIRKACEDTKRWVAEGLFTGRVAINISARQFELPDLDDRIDKVLKSVNLSPLHLECEITEGTLMQNPDQALRMMERLRERGIHLALDDFGTGYSSLAYLKKFPLNTLKIDKAFIDDIAHSNVDKHMAAAIINIAHNLGLKVVAEGVEEEEQLSILRRYECEMLQGYLYSKPLSSARFERLLRENQQIGEFMGASASQTN